MNKDAIKTFSYRISQANKTELIVVMYDMALEYLQDAKDARTASEQAQYTKNIKLAKRVIDRLLCDLDMQYEISAELFNIYMTMQRFLVKASCAMSKDNDKYIDSVLKMIQTLRKSWYEVSLTDHSETLMKNTQQVYAGLTYSSAGSSNEISQDYNINRGFRA